LSASPLHSHAPLDQALAIYEPGAPDDGASCQNVAVGRGENVPGSYSLVLAWAVCIVGGSALLHEFGHAWTARAVGWTVVGLRWRWYGVAVVADTNGKPEQLWKVALGGLSATALLALGFLAGTALPGPDAMLFGLGFTVNAALLLTNLVPLRWLDGGQVLAGIKGLRS